MKEIKRIYAGLKQKYPSARIIPSSLNEVALELSKVENSLPVVTQEWGDTWIYGIGSDPMKVAQFRQLMRLRNQWIQDGKLKVNSEMDTQFCIPLLLMAEHTWGVDVKWYLRNFDKYQFDLYPSFWTVKKPGIPNAPGVKRENIFIRLYPNSLRPCNTKRCKLS